MSPDPMPSHARVVLPSAQPMYAAAERWRDESLIDDRSLFSGQPIDGLSAARELVRDFIDQPDESAEKDFLAKLKDQLATTSPAGVQVAGELLYVHTLIISTERFKGSNKLDLVNNVLSISESGTTAVPEQLGQALLGGAVSPGQAYATFRWKMFAYLIYFFEAIKKKATADRATALTNWQVFQGLLSEIDDQSVWAQRYAIEHLLFPDIAPAMLSRDDRATVVQSFAAQSLSSANDIVELIAGLEPNVIYGVRRGVNLYRTPYRERWKGVSPSLARYAEWAWKLAAVVDLADIERSYKLDRVDRLKRVFSAAAVGEDPADAVHTAFSGYNVVDFRVADSFIRWIRNDPSTACEALTALAHEPGPESIDRFVHFIPREAAAGLGAQLSVSSALLMGLDPVSFPPWRSEAAEMTRRLTGGNRAQESATSGEHYFNFLERLDAIQSAVANTGDLLHDRLDVQGLAWAIAKLPVDEVTGWTAAERNEFEAWRSGKPMPATVASPKTEDQPQTIELPPTTATLEDLAATLFMPTSEWLEESLALLDEKKHLILQGPPGTGKTYIARKLARYLAEDESRVVTVQFHPGTSYEDFVQGLRPDPEDPSRFKVVDGPLMRIARTASSDLGHNHVLLIDEINRGNVPAIFGELYYLLEYRDDRISLLYGGDHALPTNLYIIGTMNTADRSITALDAALRRRFYVRDLNPSSDPLRGILRTYLGSQAPKLAWLAELLDLANSELGDPDLAIGPSHFMGDGISEVRARRAWDNSVLPTLREYFHSNRARVDSFDFDTLKARLQVSDATDTEAD